MNTARRPSFLKKGLLQLGLAAFIIWLFMFRLGPIPISAVPTWQHLGDEANRLNIQLSSYFYTEVPISGEAEEHMRSTIRFPPGKKADGQ